jgi:hypothetical protein
MHTFDDWMHRDSLDGPLPNGITQPEGTGLIALCTSCNPFLGSAYVPSHNHLVAIGAHILNELQPRLGEFDSRLVTTVVSVRLYDVDRLACTKQIVSMILVTSGRSVVVANQALQQFVMDPAAVGLPPQYRLFLALAPGPAARSTGVFGNASPNGIYIGAEVVYPPFGYALTFNGATIWPVGEITSWASGAAGTVATTDLDLVVGFTHTGFPCDLRTRAQIETTERENLNK